MLMEMSVFRSVMDCDLSLNSEGGSRLGGTGKTQSLKGEKLNCRRPALSALSDASSLAYSRGAR